MRDDVAARRRQVIAALSSCRRAPYFERYAK
jgi:hypothetical protein